VTGDVIDGLVERRPFIAAEGILAFPDLKRYGTLRSMPLVAEWR
jgi:hypothetical protein